jgi:hypothetical protein
MTNQEIFEGLEMLQEEENEAGKQNLYSKLSREKMSA